jgi:hypothetical protein
VNVTRRERQLAFIRRQLDAAAAAGHGLRLEVRDRTDEFPDRPAGVVKYWAVCQCGWRSRAMATEWTAVTIACYHAGTVVGVTPETFEESRRVGVRLPAPVGPRL